jgi:glycosyltransferase involved in cell wall biosynthesis
LHDGLYYLAKSKKSKKSSIYFLIELILYTRIKKIHFISYYSKKESLFWGKKKYAIIYNSSHLENISSNDKTKSLKHNYFLIVKGIEERSRIDLIIETAKINQHEHFIIVGRGPLLNFYKEEIRINSLKNIEMLGYVEDQELIILYQNAKCVLNIAEYGEGFGLPIIEAYLFNKPVLASNNCAIPEIIYNKDFLFDNTIESINNKIKKFSNEFLNFDKNYRSYYFSMFSKKVILEKTKQFIEC